MTYLGKWSGWKSWVLHREVLLVILSNAIEKKTREQFFSGSTEGTFKSSFNTNKKGHSIKKKLQVVFIDAKLSE